MQSSKQAIFKLGEDEYSLDIMEVNTIEKMVEIDPISSFSHNLKGVIRLRGDVIPVYSLRRKFGMEDILPSVDTRFVITTSNGLLTAYEVDKMSEIVQVEEKQFSDVPLIIKDQGTSYIKSIASINGHLVLNLNHDGILSEDEQNKMKAVIKK